MLQYKPNDVCENAVIACCDECGRGSLLGPVTTAVVILPPLAFLQTQTDTRWKQIRDSKKLSAKKREQLADYIKTIAVAWAIGEASPAEIDKDNILQATMTAMHRAFEKIYNSTQFDYILVDGTYFRPFRNVPYQCVVRGDDTYIGIAAASIIAKQHRDTQLQVLVNDNPDLAKYGLNTNMGYGTKTHRDAISTHGFVDGLHRMSFLKNIVLPSSRS